MGAPSSVAEFCSTRTIKLISPAESNRLYRFARLLAGGALDTAYDPGTGANAPIYDLAVQPPGTKAYVAGRFSTIDGVSRGSIARINAGGRLDDAYDYSQGTNSQVLALAL